MRKSRLARVLTPLRREDWKKGVQWGKRRAWSTHAVHLSTAALAQVPRLLRRAAFKPRQQVIAT
jgi:hypothetical protein